MVLNIQSSEKSEVALYSETKYTYYKEIKNDLVFEKGSAQAKTWLRRSRCVWRSTIWREKSLGFVQRPHPSLTPVEDFSDIMDCFQLTQGY